MHTAGIAFIALPLGGPGSDLNAVRAAVNPDMAETVGWEPFARTVADVVADLPPQERDEAVVLTTNYGQAGALDRARRAGAPLPPVFSGHNGYGEWGPPAARAAPVIVVGYRDAAALAPWFEGCREAARIDNGAGLENEEQGTPVRVCTAPREPWEDLWPRIRRLG